MLDAVCSYNNCAVVAITTCFIGTLYYAIIVRWEQRRRMAECKADLCSGEDGKLRAFHRKGTFSMPYEWSKRWKFPGAFQFIWSMLRTKNRSNVPSQAILDETLPVQNIDQTKLASVPSEGVQATWLGHASVLVQMEGMSILTDPIFSDRASFSQWIGPKRYRPPPCTINELPKIDAVIISHNHYDHLDRQTVLALHRRFGEDIHWFVPMGNASWFCEAGCTAANIHEMLWWDQCSIPQFPHITFVFTPAQHWANRFLTDMHKTLWGSWCIIGKKDNFFFAGDTGYCDAFKEIGKHLGPFTLSAIPIGAYCPRDVMKSQHVDPEEAVQIHQDTQSHNSLGIHWGTFVLTYEHYLEPVEKLLIALKEKGLSHEDFVTLRHGQTRLFMMN